MAETIRFEHRRLRRRERLWRDVLGSRIRELRRRQGRTLTEMAAAAGMSPQYLSEVERGRKEPSSEMIAAVAGALGTTLLDLTGQVTEELRRDAAGSPDRHDATRRMARGGEGGGRCPAGPAARLALAA